MDNPTGNRRLTSEELNLARWMLEHGTDDASAFLPQLERVEVTPWKCPCNCASLEFQIHGLPLPPPGVHILGDYVVGNGNEESGAFIFESGGLLSGIEFYGLCADALQILPGVEELRRFKNG